MYVMIVVAVFGFIWGAMVGVEAGVIYAYIFLAGMALVLLSMLWINENNKKTMKHYFSTPFVGSVRVSILFWILGWILMIIIHMIGSFSGAYNVSDFFSPIAFSNGDINGGLSQSFAASDIENSIEGQWFYTVFVAGTIEELVWAFILPLVFYTIAIGIMVQIFKSEDTHIWFYFLFAITLATVTFAFVHLLNAAYIGIMFLIAAGFRFLMNSSIFFLHVSLSFLIGMHQSNNNVVIMGVYGIANTIYSLLSNPYTLFIIAVCFVTPIFILLFSPDETIKQIKNWRNYWRKHDV